MSIAVKICGINDASGFDAACDAGADMVGFVFFPPSPRSITPAAAAALSVRRTGGPRRVGLFVDPDDAAIAAVLEAVPLDMLQLHDIASPDRARAIRTRFGRDTIIAVGVASREDAAAGIGRFGSVSTMLLFDALPPAPGTPGALPGGNARAFDWSVLRGLAVPVPWLVAGGLTPENVAAAIRTAGARGVDVSSGVEARRGVKDPALIAAFVAAAKACRAEAPP